MTRESWVGWQVESVTALNGLVGVVAACALVGLPRATHHRIVNPTPRVHGPKEAPRPHPAALSPAERAEVLAVLDSDQYANVSVAQVYARELDEGRYWCSPRTMHRILHDAGQAGERRRQATHPPRTIPELVAHAPGEPLIGNPGVHDVLRDAEVARAVAGRQPRSRHRPLTSVHALRPHATDAAGRLRRVGPGMPGGDCSEGHQTRKITPEQVTMPEI